MRNRNKDESSTDRLIATLDARLDGWRSELVGEISALRTQVNADRSSNDHRLGKLDATLAGVDLQALADHRAWSERQSHLVASYLNKLTALVSTASEPSATAQQRLDAAVGEAMMVRIEVERLTEWVQERTDALAVRLAEVESLLAEHGTDTADANQIERLDEIERALEQLDAASDRRLFAGPEPTGRRSAPVETESPGDDPLRRMAFSIAEAERSTQPPVQLPPDNSRLEPGSAA